MPSRNRAHVRNKRTNANDSTDSESPQGHLPEETQSHPLAGLSQPALPLLLSRHRGTLHSALGNRRVQQIMARASAPDQDLSTESGFIDEDREPSLQRQPEEENDSLASKLGFGGGRRRPPLLLPSFTAVASMLKQGAGNAGTFLGACLKVVWDSLSVLQVGKLAAKLAGASVAIGLSPPLLISGMWAGTARAVQDFVKFVGELVENFDAIMQAMKQAVKTLFSEGGAAVAQTLGEETGKKYAGDIKKATEMPFPKFVWEVAKLAGEVATGVAISLVTGGVGGLVALGSRALMAIAERLPGYTKVLGTILRLTRGISSDKLMRLAFDDPDRLFRSLTPTDHQASWELYGGKGPAPDAFRTQGGPILVKPDLYKEVFLKRDGVFIDYDKPLSSAGFESSGASEPRGERINVYEGYLEGVDEPVAIKVYEHNFELFEQDKAGAEAGGRTSMGPKFYGEVPARGGKRAFAMEQIEGGFIGAAPPKEFPFNPNAPKTAEMKKAEIEANYYKSRVTEQTLYDIDRYKLQILETGHYYSGEVQGMVTSDGHWRPMDFQGIKKLPDKYSDELAYDKAIEEHNRAFKHERKQYVKAFLFNKSVETRTRGTRSEFGNKK